MTGTNTQLLVVGVDGTPAGVAALHWAVAQAAVRPARVLAVAVGELPPMVAGGGAELCGAAIVQPMHDEDQLTGAARAWLEEAVAALPAGADVDVEQRAVSGDAVTVLLAAAREADLLVLGNHGRGPLAKALTGSVAQRCARHAACPIVLVPAPPER